MHCITVVPSSTRRERSTPLCFVYRFFTLPSSCSFSTTRYLRSALSSAIMVPTKVLMLALAAAVAGTDSSTTNIVPSPSTPAIVQTGLQSASASPELTLSTGTPTIQPSSVAHQSNSTTQGASGSTGAAATTNGKLPSQAQS